MKDSAVSPTADLDLRRMRRMFDALADRKQSHRGPSGHGDPSADGRQQDGRQQIANETEQCRQLRRQTLEKWDRLEEELVATYEQETVAANRHRNQSLAILRRRKNDDENTIVRKVQSRELAIKHQFENRKNSPGQQSRKECGRIDEAHTSVAENVQSAEALTIRRLGKLPDVEPLTPQLIADGAVDPMPHRPDSVKQAIDQLALLRRQAGQELAAMHRGAASKTVDSFYLPVATAGFVGVWMLVAFVVAQNNRYAWIFAGIPIAFVLAFAVYLILFVPLRRMTREIYPRIVRIGLAAKECSEIGRQISTRQAREASEELAKRRAEHLGTAGRWKQEHLAELNRRIGEEQKKIVSEFAKQTEARDASFRQQSADLAKRMRAQADQVASEIQRRLANVDPVQAGDVNDDPAENRGSISEKKIDRFLHRSKEKFAACVAQDSPVVGNEDLVDRIGVDFLPLGWIETSVGKKVAASLHRRRHSAVVIHCDQALIGTAVSMVEGLIFRLMASSGPSGSRIWTFDSTDDPPHLSSAAAPDQPFQRFQRFQQACRVASNAAQSNDEKTNDQKNTADASLEPDAPSGVATTDPQIEQQITALARHVDDVLARRLMDRFERIEDYNASVETGSGASDGFDSKRIPYHAIAAVGFPNRLSRSAADRLAHIQRHSLRCGIFTFLLCPRDGSGDQTSGSGLPTDFDLAASRSTGSTVLQLDLSAQNGWVFDGGGWQSAAFEPVAAPTDEQIERVLGAC